MSIGVVLACLVAAALLAAGPLRFLSLLPAACALVAPLLFPAEHAVLRAIAALIGSWGVARTVEVLRAERRWTLRLWHVLGAFDTRDAKTVPRELDGRLALSALAYGLGVAGAFVAATQTRGALRWLFGAVFMYCAVDLVERVARMGYRLAGVGFAPAHRRPIASRTIGEFWSVRWNRIVGAWLWRTWFLPLARRGHPVLGILAAFVASAILHWYLVAASLDLRMSGLMAAFFLVQGLLVLVERALAVRRWPRAIQHAWVISTMLASSPLFVEPVLRVVGI